MEPKGEMGIWLLLRAGYEGQSMIAKGCGVSFQNDEDVLELTVVMVAHIYEYTKAIDLYTLSGLIICM